MASDGSIATNQIIEGDAVETLRSMPESSVHMCMTSPPYWSLRDYQEDEQIGLEDTLSEYINELVAVGDELQRVLRDDGNWWLNLGDTFAGGGGVAGKPDDWDDLHNDETYPSDSPARQSSFPAKSKLLVPHRVAIALQDAGWMIRSDAVWCLAASTKVYARANKREGPMMVKDLTDYGPETVELWNGEGWTQVVDFYRNGVPDTKLRITLRNGEEIDCTGDHRWPTEDGLTLARDLNVGDVLSQVPLPEPSDDGLSTPAGLDDRTVGWFVGVYLAEGSRGGNGSAIQIASHVNETGRFNRLRHIADAYHGTCRMHETGGNSATINLYGNVLTGIVDHYIHGRDAKTKGLTRRCWMRSNEFLTAVLDGYLHGDGHFDAKNERWRLGFTRNNKLASDLRTLCSRLGYQCRLQKTWVGKYGAYKGEIRKTPNHDHPNAKEDTEIVTIEESPCSSFYDIEVADEPHTFALASGTLTHNSKPNGLPHPVKDRLTESKEFVFHLVQQGEYWFDLDSIREPHAAESINRAAGSYQGTKTWATGHLPGRDGRDRTHNFDRPLHPNGKNPGDVIELPVQPFPEAHYAVFPEELVRVPVESTCPPEVCASCGTPYDRETETEYRNPGNRQTNGPKYVDRGDESPNFDKRLEAVHIPSEWEQQCECGTDETEPGIALDPFAGAGTTCLVAKRLGRRFVGIDLNAEYVAMAQKRCGLDINDPSLVRDENEAGLEAFADGDGE